MRSETSGPGLHVIFGAGPVGLALAQELLKKGQSVRLVTRSGRSKSSVAVEHVAADASDLQQAAMAAQGARVIYHAVGADYGHWPDLLPPIMAGLIHAASSAGARLVYADNVYAYGRVHGPLTEDLTAAATGPNGRLRAKLADTLLAAHHSGALGATIGRASDFFGPGARLSTVGDRVFGAVVRRKPAQVIGNPDQLHTYTFVDDFARALTILGEHDEALGQVWHVPSAPTVTTRQFVELIGEQAGFPVRLQVVPSWVIRVSALVNPTMRAIAEQLYQSEHAFVVDHSKFATAFGANSTPHSQAISRTLEWYRLYALQAN